VTLPEICLFFQILGNNTPVLSDGNGYLEPAVAKQQKRSYESVSLPEGTVFIANLVIAEDG